MNNVCQPSDRNIEIHNLAHNGDNNFCATTLVIETLVIKTIVIEN